MVTTGKPRVASPIAVRRLSVEGEPGREIVVTLGKPRLEPDTGWWRCSFRVDDLPEARRRSALGGDALGAMQSAIEATRRTLETSGLVLTCAGCDPGDFGLPAPIPSYPGSELGKKIERYINRESTKFLRAAKAKQVAREASGG